MPLWINRSVHKSLNEQADFNKQIAFLIDEYQQSEKFILWLKEVSDKFSYFATESFESPNAFDKQWPLFEQMLNQSFLSRKFISDFEQTTSFGRLIAIEKLKTLIDTFDIAIKRVTGSRQYKKDALHTERFKIMVQTYFNLFKNMATIPFIQEELEELTSHDKRYVGIRRYIETVENLWTILEKKEFGQFNPSPSFNVAGATLGSKAGIQTFLDSKNIRDAITVEDFFSLVHQNLLVISSILHKKELTEKMPLPERLISVKKNFEDLSIPLLSTTTEPLLVGIHFSKEKVQFLYNIALCDHSSIYELEYNITDKQISLRGSFVGATYKRWQNIADATIITNLVTNIEPTGEIHLDKEKGLVSFGWDITKSHDEFIILNLIKVYIQSTSIDFQTSTVLDVFVATISKARGLKNKYRDVCHTIALDPRINCSEIFHHCLKQFFNNSQETKDHDFIKKSIEEKVIKDKQLPEPLFFIIKEMIKKKIIKSEDRIVASLASLSLIEHPCLLSIYPLIMNFSNTQWIEDKVIQLIRCKKIDIHRVFPFIKKILLNKKDLVNQYSKELLITSLS
ncbi:hypothetical protein JKY79_00875 [Candidatus Babeliales bacterium]|nr:hypothetical protein [Candidatus Babeliales bacterium]